MTTATETTNGTTTRTRRVNSFKLLCPFCGEAEASIRLDLNDLKVLTCSNCDEEFSAVQAVAALTKQVEKWRAVERWVGMAGAALAGLGDDESEEPFG